MARDLQTILSENEDAAKSRVGEIHTFINNEIDEDANLGFDSSSKVAEWSLWTEVKAFLSYIQELVWDEAKAELTEIKETGIAANKFFFAREWKKFQYGDDLLVNDLTGKYYYEIEDESKQIIKRLAIIQSNNSWSLKVATEDGDGNPIPLSADQLSAYAIFIDRTQPPGARVPILSLPSDKLDASFTVYYNPLEPIEDLKPLVEAAYLDYISKIDIDGESVYQISKHQDQLQAVPNVTDVIVGSINTKYEGVVYTPVQRVYEPFSGYLELDPDLNLDDLITYIPD